MRGVKWPRWPKVRIGGERGATLALVALSAVALIGFSALVIDLGNGWRNRRALIPGTDAASLAAAQERINGGSEGDACAVGDQYLALNAPTANRIGPCVWGSDGTFGWVTYTAEANTDTWFAQVIGRGDFPVQSTSSAVIAPPASVTGLRPIGLCIEGSVELQNVVNNETSDDFVEIIYDKGQPNPCGAPSNGNWGFVDFDGGNNAIPDIQDWLLEGYDGEVTFDNHLPASCASEPHCYEAQPGNSYANQIETEMEFLKDSQIWFWLPVFNFWEALPGGGQNGRLHLSAIVRVQLIDYQLTGQPDQRYLQLRIEPGFVSGTCCSTDSGGSSGNRVTALCGVDPSNGINNAHVAACQSSP